MSRYLLFALTVLFFVSASHGQTCFSDSIERYLVITKNNVANGKVIPQSRQWNVVYNLDDVFIAQATRDTLSDAFCFTQTTPLIRPIDSLLSFYFRQSRGNTKAAFELIMGDTCKIRAISPFQFRPLPTPFKEINIFPLPRLVQDEFYFDINIEKIAVDSCMTDFLFFEYFLQRFFYKKILPDKIYAESAIMGLASTYRPLYVPEVHFYLEPKAADEVIKKWVKIKETFKNTIRKQDLKPEYELFMQKLHLINESSHSKIVAWAKLMKRYGFRENMRSLFKMEGSVPQKLKQNMLKFVEHVQLLWFCSSEINKELLDRLRKQNLQNKFRIFWPSGHFTNREQPSRRE